MSPQELPGESELPAGHCREFSLLGGPLHRFGRRIGLVPGTDTIPLGLAIGLFLWVVLIALAYIGGVGKAVFSLNLIGAHARLLLVIPLLFVCETVVDPRMGDFPRSLLNRAIVARPDVAALDSIIANIRRLVDSWLLEAVLVVVAVVVTYVGVGMDHSGNTAGFMPGRAAANGAWAVWWYSAVCLAVFRFLLLRMVCRILLWSWFMWRVSRLQLHLMPSHPDVAGGIGVLEVIQMHFIPLVIAISILRSSQFTEEISSGTMPFDSVYLGIAILLLLDAILFIAPLLVFSLKLWRCRVAGMALYMGMAARYVRGFDRKWLGKGETDEPLLGTPDIQSLADLSNSVDIVRRMRWSPFGGRLFFSLSLAAILPMFPLLLFKFPITELARKLISGLVGL